MILSSDYLERVYAGVLGKLIGVYLGRPFENWSYELIMERLGEINYYVHEKLDVPLIVTDDDISGTFTFLRALADYGNSCDITSAQIGQTWMNYLIEEQTILWWGGMGNSTEHTAYMRLKSGIQAPQSGSIELNGRVVAEQIGAQIFIDGWAMVSPGDPERAAEFARRAASVSHDGEAIYGAQVIAAMEAQAFVESDIDVLLDIAMTLIPKDSTIYDMINEIRAWHTKEPDWRKAREWLANRYGYDKYGGNCHVIPNHGLIILSLLYGDDDFQKSLMIVNTSGWDTDCNSGNLGCLLGIKNGLDGLNRGPDWRGPVADRLYLPTADGGRAITDAVTETIHIANMGRALHELDAIYPKGNARFHFELPGSVQGFMVDHAIEARGTVNLENVEGHSELGTRTLALHYYGLANGRVGRIETPTFIPSLDIAHYFERRGYSLLASPTIHAGQTIHARLIADPDNSSAVHVCLYAKHYDRMDELAILSDDPYELNPGQSQVIKWQLPEIRGYPFAFVGIQIRGTDGASGTIYLDYLTWHGVPNTTLNRPIEREYTRLVRESSPMMWKKAWVNGLDSYNPQSDLDFWPEPYRLIQNTGRGLFMQGSRDWVNYQLTARLTPHMGKAGGIAVRVQGMQRYYALLINQKTTRILYAFEGQDTILGEVDTGWQYGQSYELNLQVEGTQLMGSINKQVILKANDPNRMYDGGGIGLISEAGRIGCDHIEVRPL